MVYAIFFTMVIFYYLSGKNWGKIDNSNYILTKNEAVFSYVNLISLYMIVLLSFRNDCVGTDTGVYRWFYELFGKIPFEKIIRLHINDYGFVILVRGLIKLGFDFRVLLIIQAIIYVFSIKLLIEKYSKIPALSFYLFMTFGFFIFATAMRQAFAIAFTLFAFIQIKERKMWIFLCYMFIASTFHLSALIFLPSYWIYNLEYNKKIMTTVTILSILGIFSKNELGTLILYFNRTKYRTMETGGYGLLLLILTILILGIIYKEEFIEGKSDNKMLFFMMAVCIVIFPIAKLNPAMFRILNYHYILMIIYVPNLIYAIGEKKIKNVLAFMFIVIGLYNFYYKLNHVEGLNMHPYVFFWENAPK